MTLWLEVFSVGVAWMTVVGLLIARVPKPPSILEQPPLEAGVPQPHNQAET